MRSRPCAPIAKPPSSSPTRPGRPKRVKMIGPTRITANSTRNSNTGPCVTPLVKSSITSFLRPDQRHVLLALPEPARHEPVDRPVGLKVADSRVDDLAVRRSVGQRRGQSLAAAQLTEHPKARRLVVGEAERDRKVEQESLGPARAQDSKRLRAILDDGRRVVRTY